MIKKSIYSNNLNLRDKIFNLDFQLIFLVLILGIISFFTMYSTEMGVFNYYTKSHVYRFIIFFILFIAISFFDPKIWYKSSYIFYICILILFLS